MLVLKLWFPETNTAPAFSELKMFLSGPAFDSRLTASVVSVSLFEGDILGVDREASSAPIQAGKSGPVS